MLTTAAMRMTEHAKKNKWAKTWIPKDEDEEEGVRSGSGSIKTVSFTEQTWTF